MGFRRQNARSLGRGLVAALVVASAVVIAPFSPILTIRRSPRLAARWSFPSAFAKTRVLRVGDRGSDVFELQRMLKTLGFYDSALDGEFGWGTHNAVVRFQKANKLTPDGIVGKTTRTYLQQWLKAAEDIELAERRAEDVAKAKPALAQTMAVQAAGQAQSQAPGPQGLQGTQDVGGPAASQGFDRDALYEREHPAGRGGNPDGREPGERDGSAAPPDPVQAYLKGVEAALAAKPGQRNAREVIGYFGNGGGISSAPSFWANLSRLSGISAVWYTLDSMGGLRGKPDVALVAYAKARGLKVFALVNNFYPGCSPGKIAHSVLSSKTRRTAAVNAIFNELRAYGFDGVNIDLEYVSASDRAAYTAFIRELYQKLCGYGYKLMVSVPAKTQDNPRSSWTGAFDYKALAQYVDLLMVMTYDQHCKSTMPGPVASYTWVESVVKYAVTVVPRGKVVLGVAGYGYDWPSKGAGSVVIAREALDLARKHRVPVHWDPQARCPHIKYTDSRGVVHDVWYEDGRSATAKLDLVARYDLAGIAIWRLGMEDVYLWRAMEQRLTPVRTGLFAKKTG